MIVKRDCYYPPAGQNRRLHIYLPDDYYESSERYPVMYFFDGHNLFCDSDATFGKCWGFKEFLDRWDKPMILVGMECSHEGQERLNEYCPYRMSWGFCSNFECIGDATMRWITEQVKPMIDWEYRTYTDRACTGIGGSSMGGLMALYGVLRYNWCFSKAACVSSAIAFCMPRVYRDLKDYPVDADTRVWLSWGTREAKGVMDHTREDRTSYTSRRNRSVAARLAAQGAATQIYCQVGGGHCEADWERQVSMIMDFLWKAKALTY